MYMCYILYILYIYIYIYVFYVRHIYIYYLGVFRAQPNICDGAVFQK